MPQRGRERPGGHGIPRFLETGATGLSISRGSKPSKSYDSSGSLLETQTAWEDRIRKRIADLWKDQGPEGRSSGALPGWNKPGRAAEVIEIGSTRRKLGNAQGGSGWSLATLPLKASTAIRWRARKPREDVPCPHPGGAGEGRCGPGEHPEGEGKPRRGAAVG